jgi:hypothetical protein
MRNEPSTDKATKFLAKQPTYIGTVNGVDLYEHPEYGDESCLMAITADGKLKRTMNWELPSPSDGVDFVSNREQ